MITIAIGALLGLALGRIWHTWDWAAIWTTTFTGACIGMLAAVSLPADKSYEVKSTQYIECLQDGSGVAGGFLMIYNQATYSYYVRVGDEFYRKQIDSEGVAIVYTDGRPRIEKRRMKLQGKNKWVICLWETKTVILVPDGSVRREFLLDAK